jgi:hypothetical protein
MNSPSDRIEPFRRFPINRISETKKLQCAQDEIVNQNQFIAPGIISYKSQVQLSQSEIARRNPNSIIALDEAKRLPKSVPTVGIMQADSSRNKVEHFIDTRGIAARHSIKQVDLREKMPTAELMQSMEDQRLKLISLLESPNFDEVFHQHLVDPDFGKNNSIGHIEKTTDKIYQILNDNISSSNQSMQEETPFGEMEAYSQASKLLRERKRIDLIVFLDDMPITQVISFILEPDKFKIFVSKLEEIKAETKKECQGAIKKLGDLQTKILVKIYEEVSADSNQSVQWSPSKWLGNESISGADRANWSKALKKLKVRGLVEQQFKDKTKLSEFNKGNSISYVPLTSLGVKAAKWLISAAVSNTTG